jgi:hypothetical protein
VVPWPDCPGCHLRAAVVPATAASAGAAALTGSIAVKAADLPCSTAPLQAAVKLPDVTVSSAVNETSGSFTPPGTTTAITGLPDFSDPRAAVVGATEAPFSVTAAGAARCHPALPHLLRDLRDRAQSLHSQITAASPPTGAASP